MAKYTYTLISLKKFTYMDAGLLAVLHCHNITRLTLLFSDISGLLIAGGWDATYRVEVYSPGAGYHCELPRLPYQREGHTSEAGELCGGHHNSKTCTTFSSGQWVSSRALAEKRW